MVDLRVQPGETGGWPPLRVFAVAEAEDPALQGCRSITPCAATFLTISTRQYRVRTIQRLGVLPSETSLKSYVSKYTVAETMAQVLERQ